MHVLTVTAVAAERAAVVHAAEANGEGRTGLREAEVRTLPGGYELHRVRWPAGRRPVTVDVLAAGVGPAAAASGTATALTAASTAGEPYDLVVSAGIGGGFGGSAGALVGGTAVATAIVAADLGAQSADGFVSVTELGFGVAVHLPPEELPRAVARATGAVAGPVLTVSTVTGTAARAEELTARHAGAVAEAMEGFGVAEAATAHGVPVLEIRAVSNAVGPRDRAAWRIPEALGALTAAWRKTVPVLDAWRG